MNEMFFVVFFVIWILSAVLAGIVIKQKNYSPHWLWFSLYPGAGFLLCLIFACIPVKKFCTHCGRKINKEYTFCPVCGAPVSDFVSADTKNHIDSSNRKKSAKIAVAVASIVILMIVFLLLLISYSVMSIFKNSDPYKQALLLLKENNQCVQVLGDEVVEYGMFSGSISTSGDASGSANFSFKVRGSKGKGRVYVKSTKENNTWNFTALTFYESGIADSRVNLLTVEQKKVE